MTTRLSRRTVLKGAGCAIGLPLLEAMLPTRGIAAEVAKPPVRMGFVSFPNGAIMDAWRPKRLENGNFQLGETLQPLEDVFERVTVIAGLAQDNGRAKGDGAGDHARSAASLLTGAHPVKTSGSNIRVGQSVDQAAAERIGHLTRLPSLEIGLERGRDAGGCDSGYSCAYSNNISWKNANTPMSKEINPRLVFERMFGNKQDAQTLARRTRVRQSVLDLVAEQAADLKNRLGTTDQQKVDQYFTSVREIEQRISRAEQSGQVERPDFETPEGVPGDVVEHMRLMYDLMTLAFQTDATRIVTYMLANEGSNRSYKMVGVNDGHHEISHHRNEKDKVEKLKKIDLFLATEFARFVRKLQSIPEGDGTLLDNCMIMYASGLSDGNRHDHDDLPIVLAGRAGGTIDSGRFIDLDREIPLNNLFLSMLDRVGAGIPSLGDSSGRLTTIDA
ncbi:MAG TPA: DUF1552 domain-containing protein [Pirellulaceae bacterium]|nr:DUF1552 domain-containing protein [Pirellulaceae bacterium]